MNQPRSISMTPLEWGMLLLLAVFWGGSFFFVGVAIKEFQPFSIAFLRVVVAAAVLWTVLLARGVAVPRSRRVWGTFFVIGIFNNAIPFSLIAWGQSHIASGLASILIATVPLITVIFAHFFTSDEKITPAKLAGVGAGLAGVVVLIGPNTLGEVSASLYGQLAILLAAICYAFSGIYGRRFARNGVPVAAVSMGQASTSAILLLPVMLLVDQPWNQPIPGAVSWAAVGGLAVFSTALAYLLYFRVLATAGATNLLLVNFLVPISAILLGVSILGEILLPEHLAGMVMIGCGLALMDGRPVRRLRRLFAPRTV